MNRMRLFPWIVLLGLGCALEAQATAPSLTFTPTSLSYQYQIGGSIPAAQTISLKSSGAALPFSLIVNQPTACSAPCVNVSVSSGTTPATVSVYANPTGLAGGIYTASITIYALTAATASQTVNIVINVSDAAAQLTPSTTTLAFTYVTGSLPMAQTAPVSLSTNGDALTATVTVAGGAWLKAAPTGSIAFLGLPQTITVTADATGLAPSATPYKGTVTVASSNASNKSVTIAVTLTVTAGVPTIALNNGIWPPGAGAGSTTPVTITITGSNFTAASVVYSGLSSLTTPLTGVTFVNSTTLLATIPVSLLATTATLPIVVASPTAAAQSSPGVFTVYDPTIPQVWAVVNSASYNPGVVSPGEIITIYGAGLGPAGITSYSGSTLSASLGVNGQNTSVLIDGKIAPLLYTSPTQVSCIVPLAVAPGTASGTTVNVVVSFSGVSSTAPFPVTVAAADPGVFTLGASGQGAILDIDTTVSPANYTVNGVKNLAIPGQWVAIYATGFGTTTCSSQTGSPCDNPPPTEAQFVGGGLVSPVAPVTVTIGGMACTTIMTAVPVGSVIGLLQINVELPVNLPAGNLPVVISAGTATSAGVATIAVK